MNVPDLSNEPNLPEELRAQLEQSEREAHPLPGVNIIEYDDIVNLHFRRPGSVSDHNPPPRPDVRGPRSHFIQWDDFLARPDFLGERLEEFREHFRREFECHEQHVSQPLTRAFVDSLTTRLIDRERAEAFERGYQAGHRDAIGEYDRENDDE